MLTEHNLKTYNKKKPLTTEIVVNNISKGMLPGTMRGSRGGGGRESGPQSPLNNHKHIGFLSNTGPDLLKITKLPSQYSMLGPHWHASETPFKWRFAGGPMNARLPPLTKLS